ncbi:MAG: hypothetical protein ACON5B_00935, partial [Myxococcota bacterium]
MKVTCKSCGHETVVEPPPWVVQSGKAFKWTCEACNTRQKAVPSIASGPAEDPPAEASPPEQADTPPAVEPPEPEALETPPKPTAAVDDAPGTPDADMAASPLLQAPATTEEPETPITDDTPSAHTDEPVDITSAIDLSAYLSEVDGDNLDHDELPTPEADNPPEANNPPLTPLPEPSLEEEDALDERPTTIGIDLVDGPGQVERNEHEVDHSTDALQGEIFDESMPDDGSGAAPDVWLETPPSNPPAFTLRQDGEIFTVEDLATLQRWIVERRVHREDELREGDEDWKTAGEVPELQVFFGLVERNALLEMEPQTPTMVPADDLPASPSPTEELFAPLGAEEPSLFSEEAPALPEEPVDLAPEEPIEHTLESPPVVLEDSEEDDGPVVPLDPTETAEPVVEPSHEAMTPLTDDTYADFGESDDDVEFNTYDFYDDEMPSHTRGFNLDSTTIGLIGFVALVLLGGGWWMYTQPPEATTDMPQDTTMSTTSAPAETTPVGEPEP